MGDFILSQDVNLNDHKIENLADGSADGDAVNKGQLDDAIASVGTVTSAGDLTTRWEVVLDASDPDNPEPIVVDGDWLYSEVAN
jgi:hypothetical protein